jgi:hypothetical protein
VVIDLYTPVHVVFFSAMYSIAITRYQYSRNLQQQKGRLAYSYLVPPPLSFLFLLSLPGFNSTAMPFMALSSGFFTSTFVGSCLGAFLSCAHVYLFTFPASSVEWGQINNRLINNSWNS